MEGKERWQQLVIDLSKRLPPEAFKAGVQEAMTMALVNILVCNGLTTESSFYDECSDQLAHNASQIDGLSIPSPIQPKVD